MPSEEWQPSDDDDDDLSDDEGYMMTEKTPLIKHTTGKKVFRPQSATKLSTIPDYGQSASQGSWSDQDGMQNSATADESDDRSIHTRSSLAGESIASLRSLTTISLENFREGLSIPFTDEEGSCSKITSGLGSLCIVGTLLGLIMPKNQYLHGQWYPWYRVVSSVIGYNYFALWSVCFYPQVLLNYRRKSTVGLSNDFAILNFMGWSFYSAYLVSMYYNKEIQILYAERFSNESTVQSNDVAFSVHAMILSFIYLVQIVYYGETHSLPLKPGTWLLVLGMGIPSAVVPILIYGGYLDDSAWLDYFYILSFFKICCTLTKYSKQVVLNWKRKSTSGWNIWYNFLECSGGSLSMLQIVLDSYDMQDITGITGNLAKFALGFATIFFDALFFTQHYILYPSHDDNSYPAKSSRKKGGDIPVLIRTSSRLNLTSGGVVNHLEEDDDV